MPNIKLLFFTTLHSRAFYYTSAATDNEERLQLLFYHANSTKWQLGCAVLNDRKRSWSEAEGLCSGNEVQMRYKESRPNGGNGSAKYMTSYNVPDRKEGQGSSKHAFKTH